MMKATEWIAIIFLFIGLTLFQGWKADWNMRCFFAQDASTCSAIKGAK